MKILLLEDRQDRQKNTLNANGLQIDHLKDIKELDNIVGADCENMFSELKNDNYTVLDKYSLLLIHKSGLIKYNTYDNVIKYCKDKQTPLICFTGGESQIYYSEEDFKNLTISTKSFYSRNLKAFIDCYIKDPNTHLLMIAYGENWKINLLMQARTMLWAEDKEELEKDYSNVNFHTIMDALGKDKISQTELTLEINATLNATI